MTVQLDQIFDVVIGLLSIGLLVVLIVFGIKAVLLLKRVNLLLDRLDRVTDVRAWLDIVKWLFRRK